MISARHHVHRVLSVLLGTLVLAGAAHTALAQPAAQQSAAPSPAAPPMVWRHSITDRVEKDRVAKYGVGPYADATTRLETELRSDIPLSRLPEAKAALDKLAADQTAAAKVFGADHRVEATNKTPRKVWDLYLDTPDGALAAAGASMRIRIENGTAQMNYKPPGGQFFPEGMKIGLEAGITLNADKDGLLPAKTIDFFRNTRLVDNPLRELQKQFPSRDLSEFFHLQLEVKQVRKIYEVQQLEPGGQWVKKSEISVDRVTSRDPLNPRTQVRFGRVEMEGDHVSARLNARQQQAIASSTWKGPHSEADSRNPAFAATHDVQHIRDLANSLKDFLKITPVKESKYVVSRRLLAKKGVRFDRGRIMIRGLKPEPRSAASRAARVRPERARARARTRAVRTRERARYR